MKKAILRNKEGEVVVVLDYKRNQFQENGITFLNDRAKGANILDPVFFAPYGFFSIEFDVKKLEKTLIEEFENQTEKNLDKLMDMFWGDTTVDMNKANGIFNVIDNIEKEKPKVFEVETSNLEIQYFEDKVGTNLKKVLYEYKTKDSKKGDFIYLHSKKGKFTVLKIVEKSNKELIFAMATPEEIAEVLLKVGR